MYASTPLVPGDLFASSERFAAMHEPYVACMRGPDREPALKEIWDEAARLGWTGVLIGPQFGGSGGDIDDLAAIVQGAGRRGLPLALRHCGTTAVLLGNDEPVAASASLLHAVADGSARICSLIEAPLLHCARRGGLFIVTGCCEVESVPSVTHYLLPCRQQNADVALLALPVGLENVLTETFDRPDGGIGARITFSSVAVSCAAVLASGASASARLETALALDGLLTCAEAEATIGALLENLVEYLSTRVQFAAPLADLQVLRHKTVDIYLANQTLGALVSRSLRKWTQGSERSRLVMLATTHLRHIGRAVAKAGIQLHGGMGLSQDLFAARLCRRLLMMEFKLPRHAGEPNGS